MKAAISQKGMYVRNPPGSSHVPASRPGAVILVKLRQMHPDDQDHVRINTLDPGRWQQGRDGEQILPLHVRSDEEVVMLRWDKAARFNEQVFPGGAEYFVLEGTFSDENGTYEKGTWLRLPEDSRQSITCDGGALVWRKTGHLASV